MDINTLVSDDNKKIFGKEGLDTLLTNLADLRKEYVNGNKDLAFSGLVDITKQLAEITTTNTNQDTGIANNLSLIKGLPDFIVTSIDPGEWDDSNGSMGISRSDWAQQADGSYKPEPATLLSIKIPSATTTGCGVMSKEDKTNLDGLVTKVATLEKTLNQLTDNGNITQLKVLTSDEYTKLTTKDEHTVYIIKP